MAGGGAAPQPKLDELLPHPVKDQLPNVSFCITSPPPWRKLLNFLHYNPFALQVLFLPHVTSFGTLHGFIKSKLSVWSLDL